MALIFDLGFGCSGGGGGGSANLTTLDVTPMITAQSILPNTGYDGFSLVNVSAVTSSIDPNITAGNIVSGVDILGVVGSYAPVVENLDVTPMTSAQSFVPNVGVTGFNMVNVSEVNSSIDPNITASNIVNGVEILGVTGTAEASDAVARYKVANKVASVNDKNITGMFSDIESVEANAFRQAFDGVPVTGDAVFDNCTNVSNNSFYLAFQSSNISSLSFSNLVEVNVYTPTSGQYGVFNGCCNNCKNLTYVNFHNLVNVVGNRSFEYLSSNCPNLTDIDFSSLSRVDGNYAFSYMCVNCYNLVNVSMENLTTCYGNSAFTGAFFACKNLTTFSAPNLTYVPSQGMQDCFRESGLRNIRFNHIYFANPYAFNSTFYNCQNLETAIIKSVENYPYDWGTAFGNSIFNSAFYNCINLTSADISTLFIVSDLTTAIGSFNGAFVNCYNLTSANLNYLLICNYNTFNRTFVNCYNLTEMHFNCLNSIGFNSFNHTFDYSGIKNISFPSLCNVSSRPFNSGMLTGVSDCVVHFPASMEATLNTQAEVVGGFGGTNTTVLFDLASVANNFNNCYNITASGIIGGSTFAVGASSENADAWQAMTQDTSTGWHSTVSEAPHSFTWYCPEGMFVYQFNINTSNQINTVTNMPRVINMCVSNDGTSWNEAQINVSSVNSTTGGRTRVNICHPDYYKYYKMYFNSYDNNPSYLVTFNKVEMSGMIRYTE